MFSAESSGALKGTRNHGTVGSLEHGAQYGALLFVVGWHQRVSYRE